MARNRRSRAVSILCALCGDYLKSTTAAPSFFFDKIVTSGARTRPKENEASEKDETFEQILLICISCVVATDLDKM